MNLPDISKFSFGEMTSNSDGKTSASGTMGCLAVVVGCLCFLLGCIDKIFVTHVLSTDILMQSIAVIGIGVTLLGVRKVKATDKNKGPEAP